MDAKTTPKNEKTAGAANPDGRSENQHTIAPEHAFRQHLSRAGIDIAEVPTGDGRLHRVHVVGDASGSANGWYVLHLDGVPAGRGGSWKTGTDTTWRGDGKPLSEIERARFDQAMKTARAKRDIETHARQAEAATTALQLWERAHPADESHPYLVAKSIRPHTMRQDGDALLVPLFDAEGGLASIQTISATGAKRFLAGGKVAGSFCWLGATSTPTTGKLYICEGFATAASIHELTGVPVAVAFNAGNLVAVAETIRDDAPDADIVLACDNDIQTEWNPGLTKGIEAAKAVGASYAFPTFATGTGTDINDLVAVEGRDAALRCLGKEFPTAWPELGKANLSPLPEFPWESIPPALRDHAQQVAATFQVPPEYPALAALTVAGFAMGNRTRVVLKNGVAVRPNLYTMVAMASGERKSSAFKSMAEPLEKFALMHADAWAELAREKRIHAAKVDRIEKELAREKNGDEEAMLREDLRRLVVDEPRGTCKDYLAENATEEALQVRLAESGERAAVFSADSRDVLQVLGGIYSSGQNRESTFLKAFDGDCMRVHRMGRTVHLENPSISMLLCVQTDKLAELGANGGLWHGGFIPRLIILVPDSLVGSRFWSESAIDADIQNRYSSAIVRRLEHYTDQTDDHDIAIDPDAKAAWVEYYNALEADMAGELAEHAPLAVRWQALPVRLGAIIAEYSDHDTVTLPDMLSAILLAGYLIEHARRATRLMGRGLSGDLERCVRHIRDKGLTRFTPNTLRGAMRATAEQVADWLESLTEAGYVRPSGAAEGHKRAPVYESHPSIWE